MLISGLRNEHDLQSAQQAVHDIQSAPTAAARLKALDTLQQQILRYEYRVQHHAPLFTRFGLNRDTEVLAALWKPYAKASQDILVTPVAQNLESTLVDLSQLRTDGLSEETAKWALDGRDTLKAYLMLAHPERVEPAFLSQKLAAHWSTDARITPGRSRTSPSVSRSSMPNTSRPIRTGVSSPALIWWPARGRRCWPSSASAMPSIRSTRTSSMAPAPSIPIRHWHR
jgi:type VI protein secretion system component VasK